MYEINFDEETLKFLETCEKMIAQKIWKRLHLAKEHPYHYFKHLQGRRDYKLRVGEYRVIADIDQSLQKINVTLIGHRKNIYQQL